MQKPAAAGISWIVCAACAKRSSDETSPPCARMAGFADCQKTFLAKGFGGKKSVKGNRQGFLSRSITRRSGQNCKIIIHLYILQFCRQLVKKVQRDFFDKLTSPPCARMAGFDWCFQLFGSLTASTMPVASPAKP